MSRPFMMKAFRPLIVYAALAAFSGSVALAQDDPAAQSAPATGQAGGQGQRSDGQIEMDVVKALDASAALKNDLITAATIQSEVTLSGTVATQADKDLAGSIVTHVGGVTKVHDNLQIGNPQQAAQDQGFSTGDNSEALPPAPSDEAGQPDQAQQPQQNEQPQQQSEAQPPPYPNQSLPYPQQGQGQQQGGYPPTPPPPGRAPYPGQYPPQYGNQYPQPYPGQGQAQGQYPPYPGQGQQQYGNQPQPYPEPNQQPSYQLPKGPVTIPSGTLIQVRTSEAVSSKKAKPGTPVQFTVIRDVTYGGVLAIPRGATVHGIIADASPAGQLAGSPKLALQLTSLDLGGKTYPVQSDLFKVKGPNKAGYTAGNAVGGALLGAIIGGIAGGGDGAAIGAGVGAGAGTAASAATRGPNAWIPPEALVSFHLSAPLTVDPVSEQEAQRLAQGLYPGGPSLYRRGPYGPYSPYAPSPYGPGPYPYYGPGPYPYAYPPVYYRPYYMIGGMYYWR